MDLLFVGLLALGVAVTVVFSLKFLCFIGEILNTHYNWIHVVNYFRVPANDNPPDHQAATNQSQLGPNRMTSEGIDISNHKPSASSISIPTEMNCCNDMESPPSYEEAVRLSNSK